MRKIFTVAAAAIAVLGWSSQGIANPDPHPTQAPHDGEHHEGDHADSHKEGEHHEGEAHDGEHHEGEHHAEHAPTH